MPCPRLPALLSTLAAASAAAALLLVTGCRDHEEKARAELQEAAFSFTISDFQKAAAAGRLGVVNDFLDTGMNPNVALADGSTALSAAAAQGQGEVVILLLNKGAKPSGSPRAPVSPLLAAARSGDERSVNALLAAGADPDLPGPDGESPLRAAAALGHAMLVRTLLPLSKSASPDEALRLACGKGHTAVMDVLLNAGADINLRDGQGRSPLMLAALSGELPAVRLLCHRQAEVGTRDAAQHCAADLAEAAGHGETANFLKDWAARHADDDSPNAAFPLPGAFTSLSRGPAEREAGTPSATGKAEDAAAPGKPGSGEEPQSLATSLQVPAPATEPPPSRPLSAARFPRLPCDAVNDVPGLVSMNAYQLRPWPFVLKDVEPGHEAAEIELSQEGGKVVRLRVGDTIPGSDCVVEKLRRRRVYSDAKQQKLVNVSELTFRQSRSGEVFRASPGAVVLSKDSCALLSIQGSGTVWTAGVGDEFRLGTSLLKVTRISPKSLTVENRLTRENIELPLRSPAAVKGNTAGG